MATPEGGGGDDGDGHHQQQQQQQQKRITRSRMMFSELSYTDQLYEASLVSLIECISSTVSYIYAMSY